MDSTAWLFLARSRRHRPAVRVDLKLDSQLAFHRLQFALDRRVDHRIADDNLGAADQLGIHAHCRLDLLAEAFLQRGCQAGELRGEAGKMVAVVDGRYTAD